MDDATFAAAISEHRGGPKAVAPAAPVAKAEPAAPAEPQGAPSSPLRPLKVSGGGMLPPTPEPLPEFMQRDPASGRLRGLDPAPDVAQAQADAALDEMQAPPASPSDYVDAPVPIEYRPTQAEGQEFRAFAHEVGLGLGQYQQVQVAIAVAARIAGSGVPLTKYTEQTVAKLRAQWGDGYDAKYAGALSIARELRAKHAWAQQLFTSHAGSDPTIIRVLAEVAEKRARQK